MDFLVWEDSGKGSQTGCDRSLGIEAEDVETVESMSDMTGQMEIVGRRTDEEKGKYGY